MKRVTVRTLVLMVALLVYFVAYQCLVFLPVKPEPLPVKPGPRPVPAQTSSLTPADFRCAAETSQEEPAPDDEGPWTESDTASLGRTWPRLQDLAVDPNDNVPPEPAESTEPGSQAVE